MVDVERTQPGSWGANPDVRPEFRAAGRRCPRRLPLTPTTANPLSSSGGRLRPNAAPLPLAPTKTGPLDFLHRHLSGALSVTLRPPPPPGHWPRDQGWRPPSLFKGAFRQAPPSCALDSLEPSIRS